MKDDIQDIRKRIISELDRLVDGTEQIYLDLGRDYPLLLQELNRSVELSSETVSNLKNIGSRESIDQIIDEGNSLTDEFNGSFSAMYSRDGELFKIIQQGVREMGNLGQVISNIKEISIEMELISLNAMTVALKSGTAGKAFSFITDELKKLSAQTIKLTDQLTVYGSNQLKLFDSFGKNIEDARANQDNLTENMDRQLKKSFSASSLALKESADVMRSLSGSSKDVKAPLMRIMQEVQLQDIIRQSIDHIYISIEGFREIRDDWSTEEKQDELAYRKIIPDLCSSVLRDVGGDLRESVRVFDEHSARIREILDSLEERRKQTVKAATGDKNTGSSILAMKSESTEIIGSLIREVNDSMKRRLHISERGLELLKEIIILERQFLAFEPIITRFHNIIVASRIEVAKQAALGDMRDTVTNMTELVESINSDISSALDTIKHFLKTTEKTINDYFRLLNREMPGLKSLLSRTSENQNRLVRITDSIVDGLQDFRLFTPRFYTLFNQTDSNRKKLKDLESAISGLEIHLRLIRENADRENHELSFSGNRGDWSIKSDRLKEIIDKFTIFTHKKAASDLAGSVVEAEEVVDSGEVTLF